MAAQGFYQFAVLMRATAADFDKGATAFQSLAQDREAEEIVVRMLGVQRQLGDSVHITVPEKWLPQLRLLEQQINEMIKKGKAQQHKADGKRAVS